MYHIDLKKPCKAYFIGIGGISMSGFAQLFHEYGFTVYGSDKTESKITKHLSSLGVHIIYGQNASNITKDIDFIVYTAAIHPDNPEYIAAKELGIPMINRAEMVGQVMKNYVNSIAVAGTHGKTTATSMLSHIFLAADKDPTISVGGILDAINGNIRVGHSDNFITEACEYTNSFLKFYPTAGIILNIDADHLDFFKDLEDIRSSFKKFARLIPENGILAINSTTDRLDEITSDLQCKIVTFGIENSADYTAENISFDENMCVSFDLKDKENHTSCHIVLNVPGRHNIENALAVAAIAKFYNIPDDIIAKGLNSFGGTGRRFELKGTFNGVTVIDDYAHHPTEIKATLTTAADYPHKHLWCVFQPHTYSRTIEFLHEFADALSIAENVVLTDIYASREVDTGIVSSLNLKEELAELNKEAYYFPSFKEIEEFLIKKCQPGDLIITMGAGDVVNIGEDLLK